MPDETLAWLTKRREQSPGGRGRRTETAVHKWYMRISSAARARLAAAQSFCDTFKQYQQQLDRSQQQLIQLQQLQFRKHDLGDKFFLPRPD